MEVSTPRDDNGGSRRSRDKQNPKKLEWLRFSLMFKTKKRPHNDENTKVEDKDDKGRTLNPPRACKTTNPQDSRRPETHYKESIPTDI